MGKVSAKKGQRVERGEAIGLLGNSSRNMAAHLHYAISYRDKVRKLMKFINFIKQMTPKKRILREKFGVVGHFSDKLAIVLGAR